MSKTALITGASHGIGREIAKTFAENGFRVIINYNNSEKEALSLENELKALGCDCIALKADVSNENSVNTMFSEAFKFSTNIDVLVNNAGIALTKLFCDTSLSDWNNVIGTNITGTFNCCKAVAPSMIKNHCGKIINISSVWGVHGASCEVAYSASKAAIIGFTKALAKELGPCNINVNCIAPGVIDTKMNLELSIDDFSKLKNATPMSRIGTPKDIAEATLFLASDKANFITGQIISIDGGFGT